MKHLLLLGLGLALCGCASGQRTGDATAPASPAATFAEVNAQVVPQRIANLAFQIDGQITAWQVRPGDTVAVGQVLAQLDSRLLEIGVAQAEAALAKARAEQAKVEEGARTPEIAAAEARVRQAEGQLRSTEAAVGASDVAAGQARVAAARARLLRLQSGPERDVLGAALARRDQARAALAGAQTAAEQTATDTSAAKTEADAAVEGAANALRAAQDSYSSAYWQNQRAQEGTDPVSGAALNEFGKQRYQDALSEAQRRVSDSERALDLARVAYEQRVKEEISAVRRASEAVESAQAEQNAAALALEELLKGTKQADLASARAELAAAEADLARMGGQGRAGAVQAAQGSLAAAQAELERVRQGATDADLALAQAGIAAAQAALDEATLRRDQAQLQAPFAGTIGQYLIEVGEQVQAGERVVTLGDTSRWQIKTEDLSELEVGRLQPGQEFTVRIDALAGATYPARLVRINPQPNVQRGEITYAVLFDLLGAPPEVQWGMSARVLIPLRQP
ncbi:MAG TPA: HlyD family efflux transporter periplasmic adaptor subunit [Roseiflexaceae bacterium]|nr:HlyD family efflux transporter periplasmic adaptor subunit [Roseiflexaceae bacterium]